MTLEEIFKEYGRTWYCPCKCCQERLANGIQAVKDRVRQQMPKKKRGGERPYNIDFLAGSNQYRTKMDKAVEEL